MKDIDSRQVENLVEAALKDMYGPDTREDILEEVGASYKEQDGDHHIVHANARTLDGLEEGRVHRREVAGYTVEFRVELAGIGNSCSLRVAIAEQ